MLCPRNCHFGVYCSLFWDKPRAGCVFLQIVRCGRHFAAGLESPIYNRMCLVHSVQFLAFTSQDFPNRSARFWTHQARRGHIRTNPMSCPREFQCFLHRKHLLMRTGSARVVAPGDERRQRSNFSKRPRRHCKLCRPSLLLL